MIEKPTPPIYLPETPVQQFRNAVKVAAQNMLLETGIAVTDVTMEWNEPTTNERQLRSMSVDFAVDAIDANMIWFKEDPKPYYRSDEGKDGE